MSYLQKVVCYGNAQLPTESEHLARAEKNEKYCDLLRSSIQSSETYRDWEIVGLFYSALHYVDAYLARIPFHPRSHGTRNNLVRMTSELRPIHRSYLTLYDRGRDARYELVEISLDRLTGLRNGEFDAVKTHVRSLLGLPS